MTRMSVMTVATLAVLSSLAGAAEVPIDLNTWSKRGPAAHGNWVVAADGASVLQTINGNPTFFVSPANQFNTTLRGKIKVEQVGGDDDLIGFVFGFNGPVANGTDMNFLLFDWKQGNQGPSLEGFALSRVNGNVPTADADPVFWARVDNPAFGFDNLATRYGPTEGWEDNVEYDFTMLYQENRIKIDIAGGALGLGQTIFDVAGVFSDGRFGFYNYSQQNVRYSGLTKEATPPPPPPSTPVPLPGTAMLAALGLGLVAAQRKAR